MTTQEFSNEFDVLYNNIMSNQAPGLNEYEKSVFLTKAQYEIVKNYCNPKGNKYQEGVDGSPKRQIDFSTLLRVVQLNPIEPPKDFNAFDDRSNIFVYPEDAWISINESVSSNGKTYQVVPIAYNDYSRLMSKPYKYPLKNQAWRLFNNSGVTTAIPSYKLDESSGMLVYNYRLKNLNIIVKGAKEVTKSVDIKESENLITITMSLPPTLTSSLWENQHLLDTKSPEYENDLIAITGAWNPSIEVFDTSKSKFFTNKYIEDGVTYANFRVPAAIVKNNSTISEIIGNFKATPKYKIRFFIKPTPIITDNLNPEGTLEKDKVYIEHRELASECILPEELHPEILQRAVELAKAAYQGDINSVTQMGQRSE